MVLEEWSLWFGGGKATGAEAQRERSQRFTLRFHYGAAGASLPESHVSWAQGPVTLSSVFGSGSQVTVGLLKGDFGLSLSSALGFIQPSVKMTSRSQQTLMKLFWHLVGLEGKMEGV